MVRDKESCHKVIKLLGGGVLGLPWDPEHDLIPFHIGINISQKKGNISEGLGPMEIKAIVNKRAHMKVWPLLLVCQSTRAVHMQVCHDSSTQGFLLQYDHYIVIRGAPAKVVSDKGSQLTSGENHVAWTMKGDPGSWAWEDIKEASAKYGTI